MGGPVRISLPDLDREWNRTLFVAALRVCRAGRALFAAFHPKSGSDMTWTPLTSSFFGLASACDSTPIALRRQSRLLAQIQAATEQRGVGGLPEAIAVDAEDLLNTHQEAIVGRARRAEIEVAPALELAAPTAGEQRGNLA